MIKDNYNIDIAMSATLSAQVVEQIVRSVVEEQTERAVEKITISYTDSNKFNGFHVIFKTEKTPGFKSSKDFVEQRWR